MERFKERYTVSEEIVNRCSTLTEKLLEQVFDSRASEKIIAPVDDFEIQDVVGNLLQLKRQIWLLKELGMKEFPCYRIKSDFIPIDVFQALSVPYPHQMSGDFHYGDPLVYEYFFFERRLLAQSFRNRGNFKDLGFDELRSVLNNHLKSFLQIRLASLSDNEIQNEIKLHLITSSGTRAKSYLKVKVHTTNLGLQVSATPGYFLSWRLFGSPTSPVEGYLMPGTYLFAAEGLSLPNFTINNSLVDIPPIFDVHLLCC